MKTPEKIRHPCLRNCSNTQPMNCDYTLVVEWYYTMAKACYDCPCNTDDCYRDHCVTADGVPRSIIVANRTLPGPAIEICEHDSVAINVINSMSNIEAVTLHWHGLHMKNNQYMDGVFMVSQCPITAENSFKYTFTAEHPGTHWWHAHTGLQRAEGLFGALFIRQSKQADPHGDLYDYDLSEHKVIINDWTREETVSSYLNSHFRGDDENPNSILINGKGSFAVYGSDEPTSSVTPREVYEVQQGKRYRFRVISSGITNFPLKVSVDGHNITLISSDGDDFQPLEVDAFFLFAGERYDFVLDASQEIGNYWLKVKGYNQGKGLQGLAVIRYQGAAADIPNTDPSNDRQGMVYQDLVTSYTDPDAVTTVNELRSLNGGIVRNYDHPPEKDTVSVPSGGYTVIQFVADNPGWWILHCHLEYHLEDGMALLVRVGNQSDLPPVPEGFPKCGDYSDPDSQIKPSISTTDIVLITIVVILSMVVLALIVVIICREKSRDDGKG